MRIEHIHFLVDDSAETCRWLVETMGWQRICQTVLADREMEILEWRGSRFVVSSPRSSAGPAARHLSRHGPGVVDIAIEVADPEPVLESLPQRSRANRKPNPLPVAEICFIGRTLPHTCTWLPGWGSVGHTLVQRPAAESRNPGAGLDHIVLNVSKGELGPAVNFYRSLLDVELCQSFGISTDRSSMQSQVLHGGSEQPYFNINEPSTSSSQIQEFITANGGAGIQHIALRSDPIITTVATLSGHGLGLLDISEGYYRRLGERLRQATAPRLDQQEWQSIQRHNILIDWQPERPASILLQSFSLPPLRGSQFFFELIERRQEAQGFGQNNFQELYEAVENESLKDG